MPTITIVYGLLLTFIGLGGYFGSGGGATPTTPARSATLPAGVQDAIPGRHTSVSRVSAPPSTSFASAAASVASAAWARK